MSDRAGAAAAPRVAVIGLGKAARTLHLPALRNIRGAALVGGSDPDAARRREWEAWQEPGWRGQLSHGTLYEAGIHIVDLALELFGEPPAAVFARTYAGADAPSPRADPIHLLVLEWPDGRLAQLTFSRLYKGPTRFVELRADTERASLRASYGGRAALRVGLLGSVLPTVRLELGAAGLAWAEIGNRRRPLARNPRNVPAVATARLLERILEAFRQGEEPPSSGREARDVLAVVAAAYASARTGLRVDLAEAAAWREEDLTRS